MGRRQITSASRCRGVSAVQLDASFKTRSYMSMHRENLAQVTASRHANALSRVRHNVLASIGGLRPVEEIIRFGLNPVKAVPALQQAEGDERVEEIPDASRVEPGALAQRLSVKQARGEVGKDAEFDRTEECFRPPESHARSDDVCRALIHRIPPRCCRSPRKDGMPSGVGRQVRL
jgi:hypothetical protein